MYIYIKSTDFLIQQTKHVYNNFITIKAEGYVQV